MDLAKQACIPCQEGAPKLTADDLQVLLPKIPGWQVVEDHHPAGRSMSLNLSVLLPG